MDIGRHHDAILGASIHRLGIDIVMLTFVGLEPSVVFECREVLNSLGVDLLGMFVGADGEIYLWLDDMV